MKREFMNTTIIQDGKVIRALIPMERIKTKSDWKEGDWSKEIEDYKKKRIVSLQNTIDKVEEALDKEEGFTEYERLMLLFYLDQLRVDLREDKQRVKYKGMIPKHIDERSVKQASRSFSKYRRWGLEFFEQLKEDIDVHFWGNVVIHQDETSGGEKA